MLSGSLFNRPKNVSIFFCCSALKGKNDSFIFNIIRRGYKVFHRRAITFAIRTALNVELRAGEHQCIENNVWSFQRYTFTVVPTKSDSDVILCLQLLSKNNVYTPLDLTLIDISLLY